MELSEYSTDELKAELRRRKLAATQARRKQKYHEAYLANIDQKRCYQREYYQKNREKILSKVRQQRLESRNGLPVMVDKVAKRKEIAHNWYLRNREKLLADAKRRYYEKKQNKVSATVVGQ